MKPFEEMTKAEKMKVLEEDYLERKEKEQFELHKTQQRKEMWHRIRMSIWALFIVLSCIALFVGLVVSAVTSVEERAKFIAGAVIMGIVNVIMLYAIIYYLLRD